MSVSVLSGVSCRYPGLLGETDLLLGSVGDVMALLTGESVLGVATERD